MAKVVKAPVNPDVLIWARRSACVAIEDAAKAANVEVERLEAWEAGEDYPTLPMLQNLAAKYKRPLAVMLLREPPLDFQPLRDFRRLDPTATAMPPQVALEIRTAHERRELALDMAEETALSTCRRVDKAVAGAATMPIHISLRALPLWRRAT